LEIIYSWWKF